MSLIVFAGASQFVGVSMFLAGAGVAQIIATTFFLNLRHLIMSLAVWWLETPNDYTPPDMGAILYSTLHHKDPP